ETLARKRAQLREEIEKLSNIDSGKYAQLWREVEIPEKKAVIGAEDGSLNHRRYKNFVIYAVNAIALVYNGSFKEIKNSDINLLYPYKKVEERLDLYRTIFELKTSLEALDEAEVFLLDGSMLSDVGYLKHFGRGLDEEEKREVLELFQELEKTEGVEIASARFADALEGERRFEKIMFLEYLEFLSSLGRLLEKGIGKLVGVSKLSTRSSFMEGMPDIAIFEEISKKQGYSKPEYEPLASQVMGKFPVYDELFKSLVFTTFYARFEDRKGAFLLEVPREIDEEEVLEILCRIRSICVEGYPYFLTKAHKSVVITNRDMENIFASLGIYAKTGREVLE
ncbi:MAG: DNA double-strand break repair nuclease NurA, partial [Euryarchaeota archaeon]|nr:DNA double-strand break repair nuclease NurA [Euryarchaeota archaeon]